MRVKRKTIILGSIGVVLLLLSTNTTIGVVRHHSVKDEVERAVDNYERITLIQLLEYQLKKPSSCGCEEEEDWTFPIMCGILYIITSFFLILTDIFKIFGRFTPPQILVFAIAQLFALVANGFNCEWVDDFPLQSLLQHN